MSSTTGDQLVSFIAYSFVIYPIANWLVSGDRKYSRWKRAFFSISFLLVVSGVQQILEQSEVGPNYYQQLQLTRVSQHSELKRAFRTLSLECHPDKNKSPEAVEQFREINQAYDVLTDIEKRREYNRLGPEGLEMMHQGVIDHRVLLVRLIIHYGSSLLFVFVMTLSDETGGPFSMGIFGLLATLLFEMLVVLQERKLPGWFLPGNAPYEIIATLHRMFPAYIHCCHCYCTAFKMDSRPFVLSRLRQAQAVSTDVGDSCVRLLRSLEHGCLIPVDPDADAGADFYCRKSLNGNITTRVSDKTSKSSGETSSCIKSRSSSSKSVSMSDMMKGVRLLVSQSAGASTSSNASSSVREQQGKVDAILRRIREPAVLAKKRKTKDVVSTSLLWLHDNGPLLCYIVAVAAMQLGGQSILWSIKAFVNSMAGEE